MTSGRAAALLALYALGMLLALAWLRPPLATLWGDEGSYVAMAESLALDRDLRFTAPDAGRAARRGTGVILHRVGETLYYSKPVGYPLLAAPLSLVAGDLGPLLLNVLALTVGLVLAHRVLARLPAGPAPSLVLVTFVAAGSLAPYLGWRMSEMLEVGLVLTGLSLLRLSPGVAATALGAALLGVAANLRVPNGALAAGAVLGFILARQWRRAGVAAGAALLAVVLSVAATQALVGTINPYRAPRTSFDAATGYPSGLDALAAARLERAPATNVTAARPWSDPRLVGWSSVFFLVGRHSGVLVYLPLALPLLVLAVRRGDAFTRGALVGVGAMVAFYLVYMPDNWFGGATAIGNRYILPAYAALLALVPVRPGLSGLAWAWIVASLAGCSALVSERRSAGRDELSQSHAHAGIFRWLPYETTAQDIDGRRDRYWSGEFVRFVDPFAAVGETSFTLRSADPPAELVSVSGPGTAAPWVLSVVVEPPGATLEVSERGKTQRFPVEAHALLRIQRPTPVRHHRFWWQPILDYEVRTPRFALGTPDGRAASARLRWLGGGADLEQVLAFEPLGGVVPASLAAASSATVLVRARNASEVAWRSDAPLEIRIGSRWARPDEPSAAPIEGAHVAIAPVAAGAVLEQEVTVTAPAEPGRYRLVIDLVAEDVGWSSERSGHALVEGDVEVSPPR